MLAVTLTYVDDPIVLYFKDHVQFSQVTDMLAYRSVEVALRGV